MPAPNVFEVRTSRSVGKVLEISFRRERPRNASRSAVNRTCQVNTSREFLISTTGRTNMPSQTLSAFTKTPLPTPDNMYAKNTPDPWCRNTQTMLHVNGAESIIRAQTSPYNCSRNPIPTPPSWPSFLSSPSSSSFAQLSLPQSHRRAFASLISLLQQAMVKPYPPFPRRSQHQPWVPQSLRVWQRV
jgi:hypothetical protein